MYKIFFTTHLEHHSWKVYIISAFLDLWYFRRFNKLVYCSNDLPKAITCCWCLGATLGRNTLVGVSKSLSTFSNKLRLGYEQIRLGQNCFCFFALRMATSQFNHFCPTIWPSHPENTSQLIFVHSCWGYTVKVQPHGPWYQEMAMPVLTI